MKRLFLILTILIFNFLQVNSFSKEESKYFMDGKKLFMKKDLENSKFLFEKDIVFNPKSEMSYLYLAKIFESEENEESQELNLNTVLLINPENEEAIYMLAKLKVKQSDFEEAQKLLKIFKVVCTSICSKHKKIEKKIKSILPEDN